MKRLTLSCLAAAMLLMPVQKAQAVDFKANGMFVITGENLYEEKGDTMNFIMEQHMQVGIKAIISDAISLTTVAALPYEQQWGNFELNTNEEKDNDKVGSHGDSIFTLLENYVEFPLAMLNVKAGLQNYVLPSYLGSSNPVMNAWTALTGIVATTNFGKVQPTVGYFIVDPEQNRADTATAVADKQTAYSLVLATQITDTMSVNPWIVFNDMKAVASQTYAGLTFDAKVNNIVLGLGGIYAMDDSDNGANMLFAANANMNLGKLTPGIAVSYGIQDNANILEGAANGMGVGGTGIWGNFNNSGASAPGFMSGLELGSMSSYNPFDSLTVALTVADIALANTVSLSLAGIYRMDTTEADRAAEWTAGAKVQKIFTRNMFFILDANVSGRDNYDIVTPDGTFYYGGIMSSVAGTLAIVF